MTPARSPTPQPGRLERLRQRLRVEDVLLLGWLLVSAVLFPAESEPAGGSGGRDVVGGLVDLAALVLAAACVGARTRPGVESGLAHGPEGIAYAVGPLFGAVAFSLDEIGESLALPESLFWLPIALAVGAAVIARFRVRPLSGLERRALVTPFVLATSTYFAGIVARIGDAFDLAEAGLASGLALGLGVVAALVFYVMFVFAPRQIAEREATPLSWAIRFGVFIVGLVVSTTVVGVGRS